MTAIDLKLSHRHAIIQQYWTPKMQQEFRLRLDFLSDKECVLYSLTSVSRMLKFFIYFFSLPFLVPCFLARLSYCCCIQQWSRCLRRPPSAVLWPLILFSIPRSLLPTGKPSIGVDWWNLFFTSFFAFLFFHPLAIAAFPSLSDLLPLHSSEKLSLVLLRFFFSFPFFSKG